jgi:hypothetical protein
MSYEHATAGVTDVYPNSGRDYGYTVVLNGGDPVDPRMASFNGLFAQCAAFSQEQNAVVISMGNGGSCGPEWRNTRHAIVSKGHAIYGTNATRPVWEAGMTDGDKEYDAALKLAFEKEVLALQPFVTTQLQVNNKVTGDFANELKMTPEALEAHGYWLAKFKKDKEA